MQKFLLTTAIAVGMTGLGGLQVQAATLFDFTRAGNPTDNPSNANATEFNYLVDGINLTVSGSAGLAPNPLVTRRRAGLGVRATALDNTPQLDGVGFNETLTLEFDPEVFLLEATFARVDRNDQVTISIDTTTIFNGTIPQIGTVDLTNSPSGVVANFSVTDRNDNYFLSSVSVNAVPEPLTILGAGSAIAFGAGFKRKLGKVKKK